MYAARQVGLVDLIVRNTTSEMANVAAGPSQGERLLLVVDQDRWHEAETTN